MEELWIEKYRPKTIHELILPIRLVRIFQACVTEKSIPNFIFSGSPGIGKTSVARALANELNADCLFINGSDERNIDTLRGKIRNFATKVSMDSNTKIVIIDEADYLNTQSTQPALRAFMEEFHSVCRFILTCNYKHKIIDPIHSRCMVVDFDYTSSEKMEMTKAFMKRAVAILKENDRQFDKTILATLIYKLAPDWRKILILLQRNETGLCWIDGDLEELVLSLKEKDFNKVRKAILDLKEMHIGQLIGEIYNTISKQVEENCLPRLIMTLNDYQYKDAFVVDKDINKVAMAAQLMTEVKWKK